MMVDASAMVAIMTRETDADALRTRMEQAPRRVTHGLSVWEAIAAIRRKVGLTAAEAIQEVDMFRLIAGVDLVPIGEAETNQAAIAFALYGHPSGHSARLNLGDCFSYAVAEIYAMPLLYKGNDFVHTPLG
jgi:ribonuclease VapC